MNMPSSDDPLSITIWSWFPPTWCYVWWNGDLSDLIYQLLLPVTNLPSLGYPSPLVILVPFGPPQQKKKPQTRHRTQTPSSYLLLKADLMDTYCTIYVPHHPSHPPVSSLGASRRFRPCGMFSAPSVRGHHPAQVPAGESRDADVIVLGSVYHLINDTSHTLCYMLTKESNTVRFASRGMLLLLCILRVLFPSLGK